MRRNDGKPNINSWLKRHEATVDEYIAKRAIRQANGCLLWRGAKPGRPGWFQFKGMFESTSAPICVFTHHFGKPPKGILVRHTCDDPRCVEKTHLVAGTSKDNRRDFMERNSRAPELIANFIRSAHVGSARFWASLTEDQRKEFCATRSRVQMELYPKGHPSQKAKGETLSRRHPKGSPSQMKKTVTMRKNYPPEHPMWKKRGQAVWEARRRNKQTKRDAK